MPAQLEHVSDRNGAQFPTSHVLIQFYANGAFQNTVDNITNAHRTTARRVITESLPLQNCLGHYVHLPTQAQSTWTKEEFLSKTGTHGVFGYSGKANV